MNLLFISLGCDKNLVDTEKMLGILGKEGYSFVDDENEADIVVVNTCCFIGDAKEESINTILQMAELKKNGRLKALIVAGCLAQRYKQEIIDEIPEVDAILGTTSYEAVGAAIREVMDGETPEIFESIDAPVSTATERLITTGGHYAFLKIAEGCDKRCTYCIIPYARGPIRSLPLGEAACEAKRLAGAGYRELVLTGIEISSWGHDLKNGQGLIDLVEAVCAAAPECRVRLGSLEPRTVTEDFCRRAAALPNLCPHFHLSMQSGCDATLKRMNRKYHSARYYESVTLLREHFDRPGITTDLIVGFPGETEEEFDQTLDFVRRCAFSAMHIFPYSRRSGTPAASMPGQVPKAEKEARARRAAAVAEELRAAWLERWVGETLTVLFEEEKEGLWRGHAPNYTEVFAPGEGLHNVIKEVKITRIHQDGLNGSITK